MTSYIDGSSATTGRVRISLDDPPDSLYRIFVDLRKLIPTRIGPIKLDCGRLSDAALLKYATRFENVIRGLK